ncbi:hypothetical protein V1477_013015 [Vespula maculifrons]|uniref:Uncharacterized protein n=2 Tax=Vespula TaxID=7451 RepID=A0A834JT51_VESVU|nr:hypothetical protein HZH66_008949 [Vespula vulgaris]
MIGRKSKKNAYSIEDLQLKVLKTSAPGWRQTPEKDFEGCMPIDQEPDWPIAWLLVFEEQELIDVTVGVGRTESRDTRGQGAKDKR